MTVNDIARMRILNQRIAGSHFSSPDEVVRWMGAMQAQDYAGAKWAIGLRLPGSHEADIEQAVRDRKILRTWPQRGTIHFVTPEEVRWRLNLSTPRILSGAKRRHENLALTPAIFQQALELFHGALSGDKQLSRPDMMAVLEHAGITTAGQRGYHILWYLSQTGHLCFGPLEGKQATFALLDEWVPPADDIPREEALRRLTETYFCSHGPATVHDLMWWSGLTAKSIKTGLDLSKGLTCEEVDGKIYWMSEDLPATTLPVPSAYVLPGFDELLLGYKDRTASLDREHLTHVIPGGNGVFSHTLVIDGKIEGIWKRTLKRDHIAVELSLFRSLSSGQNDAAERAFTSYGKFMGLPVVIERR